MPVLDYEIVKALSEDQFRYVETSLRASFRIPSVELNGRQLRVDFDETESPDDIRRMIKRFIFISKSLDKDVVFSNDVSIRYDGDPQSYLEETKQVISIHPGFFTLQGDFLRVFRALNAAVKRIADELGAIDQEYPTVWPVRLLRAIDYFHEFPQQVILCSAVKDDFASRNEFADKYAKTNEFESVEMDHLMENAEYGLEAAVCDCCYYGLEGQSVSDAFYTCYNKVFRNERSASGRLDRLTNFSVRDIMFVGKEGFVLEARQQLIDRLSELISELRLNARIETANDPFFANDSAMKSVFQSSHRLKYELLATVPHLNTQIAVGSVNLHLDFFGKAFTISAGAGTAHSGCIGVGMERMAYALFCQHGMKLSEWPASVTNFLELRD